MNRGSEHAWRRTRQTPDAGAAAPAAAAGRRLRTGTPGPGLVSSRSAPGRIRHKTCPYGWRARGDAVRRGCGSTRPGHSRTCDSAQPAAPRRGRPGTGRRSSYTYNRTLFAKTVKVLGVFPSRHAARFAGQPFLPGLKTGASRRSSDPAPVQLKIGARYRSQVCQTEIIVVRPLPGEADLTCGGHPVVDLKETPARACRSRRAQPREAPWASATRMPAGSTQRPREMRPAQPP